MNINRKEKMRFYNCLTRKKYFSNWEKSFSQLGTCFQGTYVHWLTNICSLAHEHMFMDRRTYVLRMVMMIVMMMGISGVWGQTAPVEITTADDITNNTKKLYLIQTNAFESFYIAPQANNTITTNNILGDDMLWYFLDAGKDNEGTENEIQYYYIVNNSTGKYIYNHNGNSRGINITDFASLSDANKEKCKFKLVVDNSDNTTDFYNIDVKASQTYYGLNKQNGSQANDNPIRLTNDQYIHDTNSKWKFVPYNGTYVWPDPPFTPSTDSDKHFYKIHNVQNGTYYVSTDETPNKVTYASTVSDRMVWYLKEAGSDAWFKYYYIINPATGNKYMYYNGTATNGNDQTNAVSVTAYDPKYEDRYQFVVVRAARGDGASRVECYAIIPKLLCGNLWTSNSLGPKEIKDGANMGIITSRKASSTAQWTFVPTNYSTVCANPTIEFNSSTGKATISTSTSYSTIYYTTDGTEPSNSKTEYTGSFDVTEETTIKAIVIKGGFTDSEVTTKTIYQVATPTIQDNGSNAISITCATEGARIYYTTDGITTPTTSSTKYTGPLTENVSGVTIKAIAVKTGMINSIVAEGLVKLQCAKPIIVKSGDHVTISCNFPASGVSIHYTTDGTEPTSSSSHYSGAISVSLGDVIRAIAVASGYNASEVARKAIHTDLTPTDGKYLINDFTDFETFVDMASEEEGAGYHYVLKTDVDASTVADIAQDFSGTFDGGNYIITGLTHPLFNTVNGGTVKNVTLKGVNISSSDENVGAITGVAKGYSRIYNCGILPNDATFPEGTHPTVTTTGLCAGGLVGRLEDDSRVINCYSYADVSAATNAAGIVGNNTFASTAAVTDDKYANLRTAIVNCMFYGDILGGTNQYGVYGGQLITNATATGISSYNYFRSGSKFTATNGHPNASEGANVVGNPTAYNCSFPAEERYLTQVEFHRSLLNSNRELCGWWVGSDVAPSTLTTTEVQAIPKDASLMYKWVVDSSLAPYPILKPFGKYPSIVNSNTGTPWFDRDTANPYEGKKLGTLTVTVKSGKTAPDKIQYIPITDMDTLHYDFGYYKVQLPYYNTVFGNPDGATWDQKYAGNYTDQVVTGWKVTNVETDGSVETYNGFVANWETGYNFVDRKCIAKDIYSSTNPRVFAQGGYYYGPDGVTAITIEAYWGKAIYVRNADASYDRVNVVQGSKDAPNNYYGNGSHFAPAGTRDNNVNGATIQTASTKGSIRDALTAIDAKGTVYDYALVLVGNIQEAVGKNDVVHSTDATRGFTIMSVDLDFDEEPDYCLEWQLGQSMTRQVIAPIRFDFLPVVELGIAGKRHDSTYFYSLGCYRSKGHFEVTETSFIRFGQFEFELASRDDGPVILNGGIYDQYCRGRNGETKQHINYVILGGHIVMPSFTPGAHVNKDALYKTRHCAVNVLGGNFTSFYLTGGYNEKIEPFNDNPHCYIDGGRFGTIAAAYKEGISGNVYWRINHALIDEFYGGGVMSQATGTTYKIVKGNIDVVIDNSIVGKYCGGPKFGDMVSGKTVTTNATNTVFNQYFGAGNGGTTYVQYANTDDSQHGPLAPSSWTSTINTNYHPGTYRDTAQDYEANYDIEVINTSTGDLAGRVINRSYYYSAQFATTNTGDVTSTLTDCTINTNFYGGGFLGGVSGNVTSTLTDCTVLGSVFGAGYSASSGTVTISNIDKTPPSANVYTGMIQPQSGGTSTTYYWTNDKGSTGSPATAATETDPNSYFYTEVSLNNLGAVNGDVTLTLNGSTNVSGSVYGGGDASAVTGSDHTVTVKLQGNTTVEGDVFGGGNKGVVSGTTKVKIEEGE